MTIPYMNWAMPIIAVLTDTHKNSRPAAFSLSRSPLHPTARRLVVRQCYEDRIPQCH